MAEVAKCTTTAVEAGVKLGGFFAKVLGEPFQDAVGLLGDRLKLYRFQNQVIIMNKVDKILEGRGTNKTRPIPPKFAIPIMEYASLEEDESLQDIWCKLLANGLDYDRNIEMKYSYIDMIKSLAPLDAILLKYIYNHSLSSHITLNRLLDVDVRSLEKFPIDYYDIIKEFPYRRAWEIRASLCNLIRLQCIIESGMFEAVSDLIIRKNYAKLKETYEITHLGFDFMQACMTD